MLEAPASVSLRGSSMLPPGATHARPCRASSAAPACACCVASSESSAASAAGRTRCPSRSHLGHLASAGCAPSSSAGWSTPAHATPRPTPCGWLPAPSAAGPLALSFAAWRGGPMAPAVGRGCSAAVARALPSPYSPRAAAVDSGDRGCGVTCSFAHASPSRPSPLPTAACAERGTGGCCTGCCGHASARAARSLRPSALSRRAFPCAPPRTPRPSPGTERTGH
mmetsp:Transcript_17163/g.43997  ORF Transcript_17163/g.43997 Transcript_17163/m.43997 type:complete len:224 (+) Transcript_17163:177-848(+)